MKEISPLQQERLLYQPKLPKSLQKGAKVSINLHEKTTSAANNEEIAQLFPNTYGQEIISFGDLNSAEYKELNVGVILSGGQAPGGHNVISGLFDGLKSLNPNNKLYGFLRGPIGLVKNNYIELTSEYIAPYRNTGGFDIIGSGRDKLEDEATFDICLENCRKLNINALVVIGGDDSNTNACVLAEYFANSNIQVVGCPKTIDGDLKNEYIETSFGFDTACKVYSELIGNIARDAMSAKKYWHFIKLMGRSASHITLECALQTQANIALISEEVLQKEQTLESIIEDICQTICKRSDNGLDFGLILIPEGLIEFIPEMKILIAQLNEILVSKDADDFIKGSLEQLQTLGLTEQSSKVYYSLPLNIKEQLVMDRDPHGNVQVSRIETEKLLIGMVEKRLAILKEEKVYKGSFSAQNHFFGYEGRCAAPSNFDADYCYSLGYSASALLGAGKTAYLASIRNLASSSDKWLAGGIPLTSMMNIERRHGHDKPVIKKALVELDATPFKTFEIKRKIWQEETSFVYPGPIQYFGPESVVDQASKTLELESQG